MSKLAKYKKALELIKAKGITNEQIKASIENNVKNKVHYFNFSAESTKGVQVFKKENGEFDKITIEGYASTKDRDRYGDEVDPTAFTNLKDFLDINPIFLLQHKYDKPIGIVTQGIPDNVGLYIKADIMENTDNCMTQVEKGILRGFSIGFRILKAEFIIKEGADGDIEDMYFHIQELELLEISLVSIPANPKTHIAKNFSILDSINTYKFNFFETVATKGIEEEVDIKEVNGEEDEDGDTPTAEEVPDGDNPNDQENENSNDNANDGEEEKKIEVEEKKGEEETPTDTPAEEEKPAEEGKNIDDEEEKDNIESNKTLENPLETEDARKTYESKKEGATLKMLEKMVKVETESLKKNFEKRLEKIEKDYADKHEKEFSEVVDVLGKMVEFVKWVTEQNSQLLEALKNVNTGKGTIFLKAEPKKKDALLEAIEKGISLI